MPESSSGQRAAIDPSSPDAAGTPPAPCSGRSPWALLAWSVAACIALGNGPRFEVLRAQLDSGYRYEVAAAAAAGLTWGRDVVATYGPLGYVVYGAPDVGGLMASLAVWQFVLLAATGAVIAAYVRSLALRSALAEAAAVAGLAYLVQLQVGLDSDEWIWFTVFALTALLSIHLTGRRAFVASSAAGVLAGFLLLAKLSTGFGAVLTLASIVVLHRGVRLAAVHAAVWSASAAATFAAGWGTGSASFGSVPAYLSSSWHVIRGFASAMSVSESRVEIVAAMSVVALVSLGAAAWASYPARPFRTAAACAVPCFLAWKQSVMRCDRDHVIPAAAFVLFVCVVVAVECARSGVSRRRMLPLALAAAAAAGLWTGHGELGPILDRATAPLRLPLPRAVWSVLRFDEDRQRLAERAREALSGSVLPDRLRALVGDRPVDVYPWGVDLVVANGLTRSARPMRASFSAYEPQLDALDADFYRSGARPGVVLWNNDEYAAFGIDGRSVLWDEPHAFLEILDGYRIAGVGRVLVLERAEERRFAGRERGPTVTVPWETWTDVPSGAGPWLAVVDIPRPAAASLRRALYREEPAHITLRTPSRELTCRFAPDIAGQGLWMSPLPASAAEVRELFRDRFDEPTQAVRFSGAWGGSGAPPLTVTWWRLVPARPRPCATVAVHRRATGTFFVPDSPSAGRAGGAQDVPLSGDWDGDGLDTPGVYDTASCAFRLLGSVGGRAREIRWGEPGDIPLAGDWDGDGISDVGLYRPRDAAFLLRTGDGSVLTVPFGRPGDVPLAGDWTGSGVTRIGVYRPSESLFLERHENAPGEPDEVVRFGEPGDVPVVGDWAGTGRAEAGVFSVARSELRVRSGRGDVTTIAVPGAEAGDVLLAGHWSAARTGTVRVAELPVAPR